MIKITYPQAFLPSTEQNFTCSFSSSQPFSPTSSEQQISADQQTLSKPETRPQQPTSSCAVTGPFFKKRCSPGAPGKDTNRTLSSESPSLPTNSPEQQMHPTSYCEEGLPPIPTAPPPKNNDKYETGTPSKPLNHTSEVSTDSEESVDAKEEDGEDIGKHVLLEECLNLDSKEADESFSINRK